MKTILTTSIYTQDQAVKFITDLYNNGESYHPEDNANDLVGDPFTKEEGDQLNKLMQDIYNLEGNKGMYPNLTFDPCELLLNLSGHVMEGE